jgi:hypothetical protein
MMLAGILAAPFLFNGFPFAEPWPFSLTIALIALLMLIWIPMINWLVHGRRGFAWSVRELSSAADPATRAARLAIWNNGYFAILNRPGAGNDRIRLRIEIHEPDARIVSITTVPTTPEPISFNIYLSQDHRWAELSTTEMPVRRGTLLTIVYTGAPGDVPQVASELDGLTITYFSPGMLITIPTWNVLRKRPSANLGVLILIGLATFLIHEGQTALILALHSAISGLVLGTIGGLVTIVERTRANRRSRRPHRNYSGLPVGLERFFENG